MKKIYIAMAVIATAALASCQQEKSFNDLAPVGENSVVFTLNGGASTRSADVTPEARKGIVIPLETENGSGFVLEETVVSLEQFSSATRGTPAYTENLGTLYANDLSVYAAEGTFGTATYQNMENSLYPRKDASLGDGWRYQHNYNGDPWPGETTPVGFYLNMPAAPTNVSITGRTGGQFTFSYTSPTTASEQQDILFAYRQMTKEEHKGYLPNGAPVLFNHALTAVKFAIGNDLEKENVSINSVTFVGLKNKATSIVMTPVGAKDDNVKREYRDSITNYTSAGTINWSSATADPIDNTISSGTYETTTTYASGAGSFGTNGNYPASFSAAGNKNNLGGSDGTQIFWLIPQAFTASSPVKLRIEYTYAGKADSWEIDFGKALAGVTWKAGDLRTYTIKIDDVNVKIEDVVNATATTGTTLLDMDTDEPVLDEHGNPYKFTAYGGTKNNVVITNTGNTDAYIRAAIIGQWLDENGNPVFGFTDYTAQEVKLVDSWYQDQFVTKENADAPARKHGTFTGLVGYDPDYEGDWIYSDGYYYYKNIVKVGDSVPEPLFTSYEVKRTPAVAIAGAVKNVYFVLEISTQAISAKKLDGTPYSLSEAWSRTGATVSE